MSDPTAPQPKTEPETKESFSEVLQHLTDAARIAASLGEDKLQGLISEIKEQSGRITQKGQDAARKAREKVSQQKENLEDRLGDAIAATLSRLRIATRDDVARLESRLQEISERLNQLGKSS